MAEAYIPPTYEELREEYIEFRPQLLEEIDAVRVATLKFNDALNFTGSFDVAPALFKDEDLTPYLQDEYDKWRELGDAEYQLAMKLARLRSKRMFGE